MKKKESWMKRFFQTRILGGVMGGLLLLYFLAATMGGLNNNKQ